MQQLFLMPSHFKRTKFKWWELRESWWGKNVAQINQGCQFLECRRLMTAWGTYVCNATIATVYSRATLIYYCLSMGFSGLRRWSTKAEQRSKDFWVTSGCQSVGFRQDAHMLLLQQLEMWRSLKWYGLVPLCTCSQAPAPKYWTSSGTDQKWLGQGL